MYASTDLKLGRTIHSSLEKQFIKDYLNSRGYQFKDLEVLPAEKSKSLMISACQYASLKLAEIESCSQFMSKVHIWD
jgi:hypothetical protein